MPRAVVSFETPIVQLTCTCIAKYNLFAVYEKMVLGNGLRVVISPMPHVRSVSLAFFNGSGGCYEKEKDSGISHFIEHLLFKGTKKRKTSRQISQAIEGTGGVLNGGTDKELTVYWCKIASKHLGTAVDVLSDLLRNSRFDPGDIEKERGVIVEEINMNSDNPQQRTDILLYGMLWPGQPLGRDVAGLKETVLDIDRDGMLGFFNAHYVPNNTVISIAGDVEPGRVGDLLEKYLGGWSAGKVDKRLNSKLDGKGPAINVEYRDIEQLQVCLGMLGYSITHPDRFAMDILNTILGEGMGSRLFMELREKHGLVYEIGSGVDHFKETGDLVVHAGVDPKNAEKAISIILEQLKLLKTKIKNRDLGQAKELIKGRQILAMENTTNVANWLGAQELLTNRILDVDQVVALIDKVKVDDLLRVAGELVRSDNMRLAAVGPVKSDRSLKKLLQF
jgi:predicted Zn-dependent peptidase